MAKIKEGFKGERFVSLPDELLERYSQEPLIANLYVRKIGYFPKVKFHYIQKERGCEYAMLIYCTEGRGWYEIHGRRYSILQNQFVIIPPDVPYSFGADEDQPWTIYWLHFKGKLCREYVPSYSTPQTIPPGENSRIQDRINLFEEIYNCFSMGYAKEYMIYASLSLSMLLGSFIYLEQFRYCRIPNHNETSFSSKVVYYMQEHLEHNLTLEQLASYFKYSPSHFSMLFQKGMGMSPINYFIRLKIQKACQYIVLTNLRQNEIAAKLGFDEPAYFSRIFAKVMGVSPTVYRKQESAHNISRL